MATITFDRELDYTLEENEGRLLQAIDARAHANGRRQLRRLRELRQPIGAERLEALAWTTQCIDCKRKEERG